MATKKPEDICVRFGRRVRELRLARKWLQVDLAAATGMDRPHLSLLETGKTVPSLHTLEKLADAFGVSVGDLLGKL